MSQDNLLISGERRLATEKRTRSVDGVPNDEHYQHFVPTAIGAVPKLLSAYLGTSASPDLNVNGSSTPVAKDLTPGAAEIYRVNRVVLLIATTGSILMTSFGDVAALTNGCKLEWRNAAGVIVDLLGGLPLKTLNDLAALFDVGIAELGASHTIRAVLDLPTPVRLDGGAGEFLRTTVQDNLTTLVRFRALALGSIEELT